MLSTGCSKYHSHYNVTRCFKICGEFCSSFGIGIKQKRLKGLFKNMHKERQGKNKMNTSIEKKLI